MNGAILVVGVLALAAVAYLIWQQRKMPPESSGVQGGSGFDFAALGSVASMNPTTAIAAAALPYAPQILEQLPGALNATFSGTSQVLTTAANVPGQIVRAVTKPFGSVAKDSARMAGSVAKDSVKIAGKALKKLKFW